jgi:hypothetical protein
VDDLDRRRRVTASQHVDGPTHRLHLVGAAGAPEVADDDRAGAVEWHVGSGGFEVRVRDRRGDVLGA